MDYRDIQFNFFGSADSVDLDVMLFLDELPPTIEECKNFCKGFDENYPAEMCLPHDFWVMADGKKVNSNLAVVRDGVVEKCFKGTEDEVNNMLLLTYAFHKQRHGPKVVIPVKRNIPVKIYRALRIMLTFLSRTSQREWVKAALKSDDVRQKVYHLGNMPFEAMIKEDLKKVTPAELLKTSAFQIGQCLGLLDGLELYTKRQIAFHYKTLAGALARDEDTEGSAKAVDTLRCSLLASVVNMIDAGMYRVEEFKEK